MHSDNFLTLFFVLQWNPTQLQNISVGMIVKSGVADSVLFLPDPVFKNQPSSIKSVCGLRNQDPDAGRPKKTRIRTLF